MAERSTLYFELREALEAGGCPICRLRDQASDSYLHALIYEGVTDPPLREELRNARGTLPPACLAAGQPAWQRPGVSHHLPGRHQHPGENPRGTNSLTGASTARAWPSAWVRARECPACRLEQIALPRTIKTLLTYLEDPDIRAGYGAAGGLCLPHFQAALGQANDAQARTLAEWQLAVYSQLRDQLNELIRKHDHRFKERAHRGGRGLLAPGCRRAWREKPASPATPTRRTSSADPRHLTYQRLCPGGLTARKDRLQFAPL